MSTRDTTCPPDAQLATLVHGGAATPERLALLAHVDNCDICRAVLAAASQGEPTAALLGSDTAHDPIALVGTTRGRYQFIAFLGVGGMGWVYKAHDATIDRPVAIKMLRPDMVDPEGLYAARLLRESQLMGKLNHPNIVRVLDVISEGDQLYVAMDLVEGTTLGVYVRSQPRPWREVIALYAQAGAGLAAAHQAGLVHRDFKPDNVLVELTQHRPTRVLVSDFGVARSQYVDRSDSARALSQLALTQFGSIPGTPAYMAPEQLAGGVVDERTDVFAFAVSVWEGLYGIRPFTGATVTELTAALALPPRMLRRTDGTGQRVPRYVTRALQRALQPDPAARPTMQALVAALTPPKVRAPIIAVGLATLAATAVLVSLRGPAEHAAATLTPCELEAHEFAQQWSESPFTRIWVRQRLGLHGLSPRLADEVDANARAWLAVKQQACKLPPQDLSRTDECLRFRRAEFEYVLTALRLAPREVFLAPQAVMAFLLPAKPCLHATRSVEPAVPLSKAQWLPVALARAELTAAEPLRDQGRHAEALAHVATALAVPGATWPRLRAEALNVRGTIELYAADAATTRASFREAINNAEQTNAFYVIMNNWLTLIDTHADFSDDVRQPVEFLHHAEAAYQRMGAVREGKGPLTYYAGIVDLLQGREAAALTAFSSLQADPALGGAARLGLGILAEHRGAWADALQAYEQAIAAGLRPIDLPELYINRARMHARLGHRDLALRDATEASQRMTQVYGPTSTKYLLQRMDYVLLLTRLGQTQAAAAALLETKQANPAAFTANSGLGASLRCMVADAISASAPAQATAAFRQARTDLRYFPNATPFARAVCLEAEGRHLVTHGDRRQGLAVLTEAHELYVRMLGHDAPRVRELHSLLRKR